MQLRGGMKTDLQVLNGIEDDVNVVISSLPDVFLQAFSHYVRCIHCLYATTTHQPIRQSIHQKFFSGISGTATGRTINLMVFLMSKDIRK